MGHDRGRDPEILGQNLLSVSQGPLENPEWRMDVNQWVTTVSLLLS